MASIYKRNNTIYISWYDQIKKKKLSKSLNLKYSKSNWANAKKIALEFEHQLSKSFEEFKKLDINKSSIKAAFEHFLKINQNKHKNTITEYKIFREKFQLSFNFHDDCSVINKSSVEDWLLKISKLKRTVKGKEVDYSKNSKHSYAKVLKKFLNFLFEYNYLPTFKINSELIPRAEIKQIVVFDENDLNTFIEKLADKNDNFKMAMHLLIYTGLRPTDIYNITVKQIDVKASLLSYYSEKTKEFLKVPIHHKLLNLIELHIQKNNLTAHDKLIQYASEKNIGLAFRRYLKEIGLDKKGYTLRTFRKSFISLAHASGIDLSTVSKLVGHHNILTTQKYYNKFNLLKAKSELTKINF